MATAEALNLTTLYDQDETAWLEAMAALAAEGRHAEMDFPNLAEFLESMAKRDKREVRSRLIVLITHLLKWEYQPDRRGSSWRDTVFEQRLELRQLLESGTLRNHAEEVLDDAYESARRQAASQTGLDLAVFPAASAATLDAIIDGPDL